MTRLNSALLCSSYMRNSLIKVRTVLTGLVRRAGLRRFTKASTYIYITYTCKALHKEIHIHYINTDEWRWRENIKQINILYFSRHLHTHPLTYSPDIYFHPILASCSCCLCQSRSHFSLHKPLSGLWTLHPMQHLPNNSSGYYQQQRHQHRHITTSSTSISEVTHMGHGVYSSIEQCRPVPTLPPPIISKSNSSLASSL